MDKNALFYKFVTFTTAVHDVTNELTRDVKEDAITSVQYKILEYLKVSQPVTPSDISECLHISMPNTSRELKKLQEKRLIEKRNNMDDRRKQYICLSNEGDMMMNKAFATIETRFFNRIQHASKEDLEEIEYALDILQRKVFSPY